MSITRRDILLGGTAATLLPHRLAFASAAVGIVLLGGALQSWVLGFGRLPGGPIGMLSRVLIGLGGITLVAPGGDLTGLGHLQLTLLGVALAGPGLALAMLVRRRVPAAVAG